MNVTIFDKQTAMSALRGPHQFTHLISIRDATASRPIEGYDNVPRRLAMYFDDITKHLDGYTMVTEVNIRQILEFVQNRVDLSQHNDLLVHCEAGISRSTAAAIIVLCACGSSPAEALRRVVAVRPAAVPNELMIALADRMLNLNGELTRVVEERAARFRIKGT